MRYLDPKCDVCGRCHWRPLRWRPSLCITALKEDLEQAEHRLVSLSREARVQSDLRHVVKDQRAHIANLEAQLLPHLLAPQPQQEAMV